MAAIVVLAGGGKAAGERDNGKTTGPKEKPLTLPESLLD